MRVSTQQVWQSSLNAVNQAGVTQTQARDLISSGQRITKSSDDPAAADRASQLRASSQAIEQYERAGNDAVAFMNAQDRTLQIVLDRMTRVEELTIAMATDTLTPEARDASAVEVSEVREELLSIINDTHAGKALFGGFQGQAVTDGPGGVSYTGDAAQVLRRIAEGEVVQVNVDAAEVFGFTAGNSVFDVLDDIISDAGAANVTALGGQRLDDLAAVRDSISSGLGLVGTRTTRVENTLADIGNANVDLRSSVSDLEDADLVEASIAMSEATLAYEAALAATAQINRVSLLNYL